MIVHLREDKKKNTSAYAGVFFGGPGQGKLELCL